MVLLFVSVPDSSKMPLAEWATVGIASSAFAVMVRFPTFKNSGLTAVERSKSIFERFTPLTFLPVAETVIVPLFSILPAD